jgi:hypothetical protein
MPVIRLLLLTNHLATEDIWGTQTALMPTPAITPKNRYSCQRELTCDISINPTPMSRPQSDTTNLGPNLSVSPPDIMLIKPYTNMDSEKAPEVKARVQPNSSSNGFKKRPKAECGPNVITSIMKAAITTI